jgi:hypothetical protein
MVIESSGESARAANDGALGLGAACRTVRTRRREGPIVAF